MKYNKQVGIVNFYAVYSKNNNIFKRESYKIGEGMECPAVTLKDKLAENGIELSTLDIRPIDEYEAVIFLDFPSSNSFPVNTSLEQLRKMGKELYLIIYESDMIKPDNWKKSNHGYFNKILTWNDSYIDNAKYSKFFWPNKIPKSFNFHKNKDRKLCTLIAGNKASKDPRELYSERIRAIRWFEKNHPEEFDLYGFDWDSEVFKKPSVSILIKLLCMSRNLRPIFDKDYYPSYKSEVKSKSEVLSKYRFCICYENVRGLPGYITEKIFDCFFAGTIPVYLGAPNVTDFIPRSTFVDKRDFKSYEDLYSYLRNMGSDEYGNYISNISDFLKSSEIQKFSAENYADTIIKVIKQGEHE